MKGRKGKEMEQNQILKSDELKVFLPLGHPWPCAADLRQPDSGE